MRDKTRAAIETRTKINLLEEADISINGPGRSMKIGMENGDFIRQHSYLVDKRMYQIFVVTPKELQAAGGGQFDESLAMRFFDSFKLARPE